MLPADLRSKAAAAVPTRIVIADPAGIPDLRQMLYDQEHPAAGRIAVHTEYQTDRGFQDKQGLVLISPEGRKQVLQARDEGLRYSPSVLILKP